MTDAKTAAPTVSRTPIHKRVVSYQGYARSDGRWDIEAHLVDTKGYTMSRFGERVLEAGKAAHDMSICVTVDDALTILDIRTGMAATPFGECQQAIDPMRGLIGAQLGRGWRKTLNAVIGGEAGCTHLRELLGNLATAALQTVPPYRKHLKREQGMSNADEVDMPHFVGQCMTWRRGGPTVARIYPQFSLTHERSTTSIDPAKE